MLDRAVPCYCRSNQSLIHTVGVKFNRILAMMSAHCGMHVLTVQPHSPKQKQAPLTETSTFVVPSKLKDLSYS